MTVTVGAAAGPGFAPIEKAYGKPLDSQRVYARLGSGFPAGWAALADPYRLDMSVKFTDANGKPYPATDIYPGKKHDEDFIKFFEACAALPHRADDPHKVAPEHEEEAKAAAGSGTPGQLNDAMLHVADIAYGTPGFAANCEFGVCWTGYDLRTRDLAFRPSLAPAEFIALDPYLFPGDAWVSFDGLVGPELDYVSANHPNLKQYIWEFGCDNRPGRSAWLRGIPGAVAGNPKRYSRLLGLDYFNIGSSLLDATGLQALAAAYQSLTAS